MKTPRFSLPCSLPVGILIKTGDQLGLMLAAQSQRTQSHSSWWQGDPPVPFWVALLLRAARTGRGTAPGLSGSSRLPPTNGYCSSFHRSSAAIGFDSRLWFVRRNRLCACKALATSLTSVPHSLFE